MPDEPTLWSESKPDPQPTPDPRLDPTPVSDKTPSFLKPDGATLPERLGPYRVEGHLGSGGMGEVFRGFDERLTRSVAIKWIRPALVEPDENPDLSRRRFRREARAAARINHPSIVQIYHILELHGDGDAIVMELVDGQSLAQILRQKKRLSPRDVVDIGLQISRGLAEAHRQGVIHRDLKPANIMLAAQGQVKILDFGLATGRGVGIDSDRLTRPGEAVGSYDTMSPEQAQGQDVDARSDLFSFGILLYVMLSGQRPFWGDNPLLTVAQICHQPHPDLRPSAPDAPPDLIELIDLLLEKHPINRPQKADQVVESLGRIARQFTSQIVVQPSGPALRALALVEIVDRDALWDRLGERGAGRWLARLEGLLEERLEQDPSIRRFDLPQGTLLMMENPIDAASMLVRIHQKMQAWNTEDGEDGEPVHALAVIHFGEVRLTADSGSHDVDPETLGGAAALVARLADHALPGQTLLTRSAFDLSRSAAGSSRQMAALRWLAHGSYQVGEEEVELFEVGEPGIAPFEGPRGRRLTDSNDPLSQTILGWRPAAGQSLESHPHWRLIEQMRSGVFGEVWLSEHLKTGERRIFKFCFQQHQLRELKREIALFQILKGQLGEREDIARILDWNFEEPPYFIESEYTDEGHLLDWLKAQGSCADLPLKLRLDIVAQVADALAAAHSVGVLHKDVKPTNILIQSRRPGEVQVRLSDFGIGTVTADADVAPEEYSIIEPDDDEDVAGEALYRAPELFEGRVASIQADIYALGVLLYQMVIGDMSRAVGSGWERDIDDELLVRDITMAVDVSPARRFADAGRLAQRLRHLSLRRARLEEQKRIDDLTAQIQLSSEKGRRRKRLAAWTLAGLALLLLGLLAHNYRIDQAEDRNRVLRQDLTELRASRQGTSAFWTDLLTVDAESGRRLIDRAADAARSRPGLTPRARAGLYLDLGQTYLQRGDYPQAEAILEEAFWTFRSGEGQDDLAMLKSGRLLARAELLQGQPEAATERLAELRRRLPELDLGAGSDLEGALLAVEEAAVLDVEGRLPEAVRRIGQALGVLKLEPDIQGDGLWQALELQAHILDRSGDRSAALEALQAAAEAAEAAGRMGRAAELRRLATAP